MQIYSLVNDIYKTVATKEPAEGVDLYDEIDRFGENCKRLMSNLFTEKRDGRTIRMSNIGRDDRYLWNVVNNPTVAEELTPNTHVKFMYGHLIEELLLFLTRLAGHEVTDEQKKCEVNGVTGSMDCKIDGVVTDVKSVSTFGFKKFKDGSLAFDDPFGYVAQIKGIRTFADGGDSKFWLASNGQAERTPNLPDVRLCRYASARSREDWVRRRRKELTASNKLYNKRIHQSTVTNQ